MSLYVYLICTAIYAVRTVRPIAREVQCPRPTYLEAEGPIRDGTFETADGQKIAYRQRRFVK